MHVVTLRSILAAAAIVPLLGMATPALSTGPRDATESHSDTKGVRGVVKGGAASAMLAELTRDLVPCVDAAGAANRCRLLDAGIGAEVHYGTIAESGDHVALVTVRWNPVADRSVVETRALVFVSAPGKEFHFVDATDIAGTDVSEVRFEPYRISYAATYLRPDDAPSEPTGLRRYEIVHGTGRLKVRIRETDVDMPPARPKAFTHS